MIDHPLDLHLYNLWKNRGAMPLHFSRISVSGLKRLPTHGPAIIAPNHLNWKDVFFVGAMVQQPICFAATIELFDYQLCKAMLDHYFGQYLKGWLLQLFMKWFDARLARWLVARVPRMGAIPVRRSILDKTFFERAKERLLQGKILCIFPEGGTSRPGSLRRFKLGTAKLLCDLIKMGHCRIPVFPVGLGGTLNFFVPGRFIFFHVGEPIFLDDFLSENKQKQSLRMFSDRLHELVFQLINKESSDR